MLYQELPPGKLLFNTFVDQARLELLLIDAGIIYIYILNEFGMLLVNDLARKKIKPYLEFQQFLSKSPDAHYRAKYCTGSAALLRAKTSECRAKEEIVSATLTRARSCDFWHDRA
ncbi:hypothetical protein R6Q59_016775 [Mikania micrantha]